MVKPIELDELLLRVRALLRRANIEMERRLSVGNLTLDADAMSAVVNGMEIPVTTREFNILFKLLSYPNKTFSRAQLMDEFWGLDSDTSLRAVGARSVIVSSSPHCSSVTPRFSPCACCSNSSMKLRRAMRSSTHTQGAAMSPVVTSMKESPSRLRRGTSVMRTGTSRPNSSSVNMGGYCLWTASKRLPS